MNRRLILNRIQNIAKGKLSTVFCLPSQSTHADEDNTLLFLTSFLKLRVLVVVVADPNFPTFRISPSRNSKSKTSNSLSNSIPLIYLPCVLGFPFELIKKFVCD